MGVPKEKVVLGVIVFLILAGMAFAHVCGDVVSGGQVGCPDPQTVDYVSDDASGTRITIVADITALHVQWVQTSSCTGGEADGCYDNNDYEGKCNPGYVFDDGFSVQQFTTSFNQGSSSYVTISSSPSLSYSLADRQTQRFNIYLDIDEDAPTQNYNIDIGMRGSLSSVTRPIFNVAFTWEATGGCSSNADCSGGQICCSNECVDPVCTQASDCGSQQCRIYTCNNANTCTASCSTQTSPNGASCSGGFCCSGVCDTSTGHTDYDTDCRSTSPSCVGSSYEYAPANNGQLCGGYECMVCDSGYCDLEQDSFCGGAEICTSGTCVASCTDECSPNGAFDCATSTTIRTCSDVDSDGCLEWSTPTDCPDLVICQEPLCSGSACGITPVGLGLTDELCYDDVGCTGGNCKCDGSGSCTSQPSCTDQCSSGETQCSGIQLQTCELSGSCYIWGAPSDCPDTICYEPSCTSGACTANPVSTGITDEACHDSTGCTGGYCRCNGAGACTSQPGCTNQCTTSGALRCDGLDIETCADHNSDGCLEWGQTSTCTTSNVCMDPACSSGVCGESPLAAESEPTGCTGNTGCIGGSCKCDGAGLCTSQPGCTNLCTPAGALQCNLLNVTTCGNYDADVCLEWGNSVACADDICMEPTCASGVCGETPVPSGNSDEACHDDIGCTGGSCRCDGSGSCYSNACVPDCAGKECGDDGCGGTCGSCTSYLDSDTVCYDSGTCSAGTCNYELNNATASTDCCDNLYEINGGNCEIDPDPNSDNCDDGFYCSTSCECVPNACSAYTSAIACNAQTDCTWCPFNSLCRPMEVVQCTDNTICYGSKTRCGPGCQFLYCSGNEGSCGCEGGVCTTCAEGEECEENVCSAPFVEVACTPQWECDSWSACSQAGFKSRLCYDVKNCNSQEDKPTTKQACEYVSTGTGDVEKPEGGTGDSEDPEGTGHIADPSGSDDDGDDEEDLGTKSFPWAIVGAVLAVVFVATTGIIIKVRSSAGGFAHSFNMTSKGLGEMEYVGKTDIARPIGSESSSTSMPSGTVVHKDASSMQSAASIQESIQGGPVRELTPQEQKLHDYVKVCLANHQNLEQITETLAKAGWKPEMIQKVLEDFRP